MSEAPICEKHKVKMGIGECYRCGGDGYTDQDIEDMDNPLEFSDGNCWQCKGTGRGFYDCELCEEDAQMELEMESEQ